MDTLDKSNVFGSLQQFPDQCLSAWQESSHITFTDDYKQVKNIVICGMGGSRFTPKTIKYLYQDQIRLPYEIIDDYHLPAYVNSDSLVVLSSYSGTTEEVIACGQEAIKRGTKLTGITSGGPLADMLKNHPAYIFNPAHNPSSQPRVGGGYLLLGHLGLLHSLNLVTVTDALDAISFIRQLKPQSYQPLASILKDKHVSIITAEFLTGFGNGFANQLNETAKLISDYRHIPELNHHLMEGLTNPASYQQSGLFVFITSDLYSPKIIKRFAITQEVVTKQNIATHEIKLQASTKLAQVLEAYTLSGFASYYLSQIYGIDPAAIPWVDYFKQQLKT